MKTPDRCPVCGRMPKVITYDTTIAWVECKPWYRFKAHEVGPVVCAQPSKLFDAAIDAWNEKK